VSRVFISYRRQDSAGYARPLHDALVPLFGKEGVFLDLDNISPGEDFTNSVRDAIAASDVMLVLIGPQWLSATDARGHRRIDGPDDFIRSEIATALAEHKRVVPVLVGGGRMPSAADLPPELRGLVTRLAVELRDDSWTRDVEQLRRSLDGVLAKQRSARPVVLRPSGEPAQPGKMSFLARSMMAIKVLLGRSTSQEAGPRTDTPPSLRRDSAISEPPPHLPPPTAHQVFVSYSSKDSAVANKMVGALEERGRVCWIAPRDIPPGVPSWAEPIVMAIASSRLVLVLLTKNSIPSVDVLREVTLAADEKIPLLPVSLDASLLSPALRYYFVAGQRLDLTPFEPEEQVRQLLPAVEKQLHATL
jgi:hypothetical protein